MTQYYTIKIPLTENDLQELQSGEEFHWTFTTKENEEIKINVELLQSDEEAE